MLASAAVCKKRLLKAELCFVARNGCQMLMNNLFIGGLCDIRITIYSSDGICEV